MMKKNHPLVIAFLFLFYAINNFLWLAQNKLPVTYDEGVHLWTSMRFLKAFINPTHEILYELMHANATHWPPLFPFVASLFNLIFGTSYVTSVMTNMLFFLLLILALYLTGKRLFNPETGLISVIIASLYPVLYGSSRLFQPDFALTSLVVFSVYSLISSEDFCDLKWSLILGAAIGLGMLVKWTYIFFIAPVFLYVFITAMWYRKNGRSGIRMRNAFLSATVGFLISSVWYTFGNNQGFSLINFMYTSIGNPMLHYFKNIYYYLYLCNNVALSFLFFSAFIISLPVLYARKKTGAEFLLTAWYLPPFFIFCFVMWIQPRFLMPIFPCLALITAVGIDSIRKQRIRRLVLGVMIVIGLCQYFNVSFSHRQYIDMDIENLTFKDMELFYAPHVDSSHIGMYSIIGAGPPHRIDWRHADIARSFAEGAKRGDSSPFMVGIICDENDVELDLLFANRVMNYYLTKELMMQEVALSVQIALTISHFYETDKFIEYIPQMRGLLYISKRKAWPELTDVERFFKYNRWVDPKWADRIKADKRVKRFIDLKERFVLTESIALPYNYYAYIYLSRDLVDDGGS